MDCHDIRGPQRMNSNDFSAPLTFHLAQENRSKFSLQWNEIQWNVSTSTRWTCTTFCTNHGSQTMKPTDFHYSFLFSASMRISFLCFLEKCLHVPLRMNCNNFACPFTFPLVPSSSQNLNLSNYLPANLTAFPSDILRYTFLVLMSKCYHANTLNWDCEHGKHYTCLTSVCWHCHWSMLPFLH